MKFHPQVSHINSKTDVITCQIDSTKFAMPLTMSYNLISLQQIPRHETYLDRYN